MNSDPTAAIDLGRSIGQAQAFGLIASKCGAAQAQCLRAIHDQRLFQSLGVTWEEFCTNHAGISRSYADQILRNLEEFGETYFRLSEILHISEPAYRAISPSINNDSIELEGESIPITPENAPRIRKAIATLRSNYKSLEAAHWFPHTHVMQGRIDAVLAEMEDVNRRADDERALTGVGNLCEYTIARLQWLARQNAEARSQLTPSANAD